MMLKVLKSTTDSFSGSRYWGRYKTSISRNSNVNDFDPNEWIIFLQYIRNINVFEFSRSSKFFIHFQVAHYARMNEFARK